MNSRVKNLVGKRNGNLTVISYNSTRKNISYWNCLCDCGKVTVVAASNLWPKKTSTCGTGFCKRMSDEDALSKIIFRDYRHRAKYDEMEFTLTWEEVKSTISKHCYYCGCPPENTKTRMGRTHPYNGIDRIDSSKGYTQDNIRPCCGICNVMKLDLTETEFKNKIVNIYENWAKKSNTDEH